MESAGAVDNGAYVSKGCQINMCTTKRCARLLIMVKMTSGTFYLKSQAVRQAVDEEDIAEMQRHYRISKCNPNFSKTFVTVRRYLKKNVEPYYLVIYKLQGEESQNFVMPRHRIHTKDHIIKKISYLKTKWMN